MGICKLITIGSSSSGNSFILQCNDDILLIEAGIKWDSILKGLNFNLEKVRGVLISHSHL